MTARPLVDVRSARRRVVELLTGQPTGRQADSERSERSGAGNAGAYRVAATVPDDPRNEREAVQAARQGIIGAAGMLAAARALARRGGAPGAAPAPAAGTAEPGAVARAQLETFRTSFPGKDQLGTKFTEPTRQQRRKAERAIARELEAANLEAAGAVLAEQLADDPRAHYFRRAVAAALEPWWPRRAVALATCGEAGARCDCADCGTPHVLPYRCGARACPTCARQASAIACEKVARQAESAALELLEPWDGIGPARKKAWRVLVLTTAAAKTEAERYDADTLRASVLAVRRAWGPFWRGTPWGRRVHDVSKRGKPTKRVRRDTLAAMGMEIGDGGMVHIHAAIYGEFVDAQTIAAAWKKACPMGGHVYVRLMREHRGGPPVTSASSGAFRNALREVLKYLTKGHKTAADLGAGALVSRARRAAAAEYALRNQRRVETCGALRLVPSVSAEDVATEGKACTSCSAAPSAWTWRGLRAPEYVRQNGGFGVAHIVDDDDAEQRRQAARIAWLEVQQHARERAAAVAHEYRPGGRYYGGEAPPWYDDPADEYDTVEVARGRTARSGP